MTELLFIRPGETDWNREQRCEVPNTGLHRLRWKQGTFVIETWADATHLADLPPQPSTVAGERPEPVEEPQR